MQIYGQGCMTWPADASHEREPRPVSNEVRVNLGVLVNLHLLLVFVSIYSFPVFRRIRFADILPF